MPSENTFLRFGAETNEKYQHLRTTVFDGASNSQVFMLAMAYAFHAGIKDPPAFQKSNNGPRTELSETDFFQLKLLQLAVSGDAMSLSDTDARYELAMRYAEAGITLLSDRLEGLSAREARKEVLAIMLEVSEST